MRPHPFPFVDLDWITQFATKAFGGSPCCIVQLCCYLTIIHCSVTLQQLESTDDSGRSTLSAVTSDCDSDQPSYPSVPDTQNKVSVMLVCM